MGEEKTKPTESTTREYPSNRYTDIVPKKDDTAPKTVKKANDDSEEKRPTVGERIVQNLSDEKIKKSFISDWLFPGIESLLKDVLHGILLGIFGREASVSSKTSGERNGGLKYHRSSLSDSSVKPGLKPSKRPRITFEYKDQAEEVWSMVGDDIDNYGVATLKDFYSYVDQATSGDIKVQTSFAMTSWGWHDISEGQITHTSDGWLMEMPMAEPLSKKEE